MTAALTTSVAGTDAASAGASASIGDAIGGFFTKVGSNADVQQSVGGAIGSVITAGLGAIGLPQGKTPDQIAAEQAAAAAAQKAQQTQMLVIGGGIAVVVIGFVIVMIRRSS